MKIVRIGSQYDFLFDLDLPLFDARGELVEIVDDITGRGGRYDGNRIIVFLVLDDLNLAARIRGEFQVDRFGWENTGTVYLYREYYRTVYSTFDISKLSPEFAFKIRDWATLIQSAGNEYFYSGN